MADHLISEGDNVVLDERGEKLSFVKIKASGKVKLGKLFLPMAPIVGVPFGSMFQVSADGKSLIRSDRPIGEYVTNVLDTERDNSSLCDRNTENQKLGHEEVEALKRSGKTGAEIVEELCSNSSTFESKTEFSQDKYKRKKARKYIVYAVVRQPTARAVCQAYYDKGPERVFNLRVDTLSVMLNMANISAGAKVLVLDNCMGVVAGAVLERMGGMGSVCCAHVDRPYGNDAIRCMNLSEAQQAIMCCASVAVLKQAKVEQGPPATNTPEQADAAIVDKSDMQAATAAEAGGMRSTAAVSDVLLKPGADGATAGSDVDMNDAPSTSARQAAAAAGAAGAAGAGAAARKPAKQLTNKADAGLLQQLVHPGFSGCIVAAPKLRATSIMDQVLTLLQPSATFVVFSPWVQPLAECMAHLQSSKQAVMLQLHESWLRPHQVLPMRTHPMMSCSGTGGFILTGIKVLPDEPPAGMAAAAGSQLAGAKQFSHSAGGRGIKRTRR